KVSGQADLGEMAFCPRRYSYSPMFLSSIVVSIIVACSNTSSVHMEYTSILLLYPQFFIFLFSIANLTEMAYNTLTERLTQPRDLPSNRKTLIEHVPVIFFWVACYRMRR